jgi:hypothetical protein
VSPDRFRVPVLVFLRDEVTALDEQDARARVRERVRNGAATGTRTDDDDVEVSIDT